MPNLDGTGPENKGPLTGRKRGKCLDKRTESGRLTEEEHGYGYGVGGKPKGRGRRGPGQGFGRRFRKN